MRRIAVYSLPVVLAAVCLLFVPHSRAADTLPNQLPDDAYWKLIDGSSESSGEFQSENFLSNETGFEYVIPALKQTVKPGSVYMGVGPEQNFTYIANLRPKMAFVIDIRRQNMLEHMIYKALFEISSDRADFLSRLFSKKRPASLNEKSTVDQLFDAYTNAPVNASDGDSFRKNLQEIKDLLVQKHKFGLTADDLSHIEHVFTVFRDYGPAMNYSSGAARGGGFGRGGMPNYADLMTASDQKGNQLSYLASEENFRFLKDMEARNMIVALTGDFGGPKAIRAVAQWIRDHNATVTAFYLSNVEQYLFQGNGNQNGGWKNFYASAGMLPLDSTSTFIRSIGGGGGRGRGFGGGGGGFPGGGGMRSPNVTSSMQATIAAVKSGKVQTYSDILGMSK